MVRKVLVGILLLGALFIFGLATFYVKNWQFYLGKGYRLTANFPAVQTLDKGDLVRLAGVQVGAVEDVAISTEAATKFPVHTVLWIRSGVKVRSDDTAAIQLLSIFGGSYVAIERGNPAAPELHDGDEFRKTEVAPSIAELVQDSKVTLAEVKKAFEDVEAITVDVQAGKGTLGRLLTDEEMSKKVQDVVDNVKGSTDALKQASDRLEKGEGVLGKLVMNEGLSKDFDSLVADTRRVTENLRTMTDDLRKGEGTIGKLLASDELYNKLNDSITTISDSVKLFKQGEGILPKLLEDKAMADDLEKLASDAATAATNLKDVTDKLRTGESTLGKLMESDDIYKKITQLFDSVQGIVDTYREQSPVISFAGAVFGAF
jgi:phospholipid/cholesterol/gamma-HCH transport system substrate-binding protein